MLEVKAVFLPQPREIGRAGLGPLGIVIAGNDMAGELQAIEEVLRQPELLARAVFGHVARQYDKAESRQRIDVAHGGAQILLAGG